MTGRSISIVALMTLLLGGGTGYLKLIAPAVAEHEKLKTEHANLDGQSTSLDKEVTELRKQINGMAMSTISYFDLTGVENKRRIMEAKTVETLASLTEIFNEHHIMVQSLDPKGETTGLNKPAPPPPAPVAPNGPSPLPTLAAATPTPAPGSTPAPAPIQLTHKVFTFDLRGEYPDFVKAMEEIQNLPRAISVSNYSIKLVNKDGKDTDKGSGSLLSLTFNLSITFLMDTAGNVGDPNKHAEGFLAWAGDLLCPPAEAHAPFPWEVQAQQEAAGKSAFGHGPRKAKTAAKAPFALRDVVWTGEALRLDTFPAGLPAYHVTGARPGFLELELHHTASSGTTFFHPRGPHIKRIQTLPSPKDPGATRLAITAEAGTRLAVSVGKDGRLCVYIGGAEHEAPANTLARRLIKQPAAVQLAAATPRPVATKPMLTAARPMTTAAKSMLTAAKPQPPAAHPAAASAMHPEAAKPLLAVLPPRVTEVTGPVASAPSGAAPLKIVVRPHEVQSFEDQTEGLQTDRDAVPTEESTSWNLNGMREAASETAPLHPGTSWSQAWEHPEATPASARPEPTAPAATQLAAPLPEPTPTATPTPMARPQHAERIMEGVPPRHAEAARELPAPKPKVLVFKAASKPAARRPKPGPAEGVTHLDAVHLERNQLVLATHGAAPRFQVLGGNNHLLLLSVEGMPVGGAGKLFPVGQAGIKQVRAALFDARTQTSHVAIDTDGHVRLHLVNDPNGAIRLRIDELGAKPGLHVATTADVTTDAVTEVTSNHVVPGAQPTARPQPKHPTLFGVHHIMAHPAAVHATVIHHAAPKAAPVHAAPRPAVAHAPKAAPTPMALAPHPAHAASGAAHTGSASAAALAALPSPSPLHPQLSFGSKPGGAPASTAAAPTPEPTPTPKPRLFENRHLENRADGSGKFPLDKSHQTGRQNPFRPLNAVQLPGPNDMPAKVPPPPVPLPGGSTNTVTPSQTSMTPSEAAPLPAYTLKAVVLGGGMPPMALVSVQGKTVMVGLNGVLPGNARVKSIQAGYVLLSAPGRTVRVNLQR